MDRRKFIQQTSAAASLAAIGGLTLPSFTTKEKKHITILHTNDTHSHVEPFEATHYKYANKGGVARRATLIETIRKENPNTLLLDAGDIFQGTPYFNYFGGELELKLMSMLKYDQIFKKDGIKIGIFGLGIKLEGLVNPKMYKETKYLDPIETSQDMSRILKEEQQCDLVICLSHLGYYYRRNPKIISDLNLAKSTQNIDLIIGGHTHTFLPKPTIVKNSNNQNMLVNQVGSYGINLGRIDFYFDQEKNITSKGKSILV